MTLLLGDVEAAGAAAPGCDEHELYARIRGEYRELPGLRLTLPQAARLFNLELTGCERVFDALVREGFLATDGRAFCNAGAGNPS
jgi:hypothetical protein